MTHIGENIAAGEYVGCGAEMPAFNIFLDGKATHHLISFGECGIVGILGEDIDTAGDEADLGIGRDGCDPSGEPVRFGEAVRIGEDDDLPLGVADAGVTGDI